MAGPPGVNPGAHGLGGKGRRLLQGEADKGPGLRRRQSPGQAGHLQEHGNAAGVVVGPGGAGHGVEMGPQDVVTAGGLVSGDDIGHLVLPAAKGLAPGRITQGRKILKNIVFGRLQIAGAVDGAVPQGDAQVGEMSGQVGTDSVAIHRVTHQRGQREPDDGGHDLNQDESRF